MGVMPVKRDVLGSSLVKGVTQIKFNQWKEERTLDVGPYGREKFKGTFLMNSFLLCCEGPNSKIHQFKDRKYDNRGIRHDVHTYIEVGSDNSFQF